MPDAEGGVGLLGGSFDPPHIGHLLLAQAGRRQLKLDQVVFLPVGQPPHKGLANLSPLVHRVAMTQLAMAHEPAGHVDLTDAHRPPPHYTSTLLPLMQARTPGPLWLLLGADSLRDLLSWHAPAEIVAQARLAVLPRPGVVVDWEALERHLPGLRAQVVWLEGPHLALSSTQLRAWAQAGHPLTHLTPPAVEAYIQTHRLYLAGPEATA